MALITRILLEYHDTGETVIETTCPNWLELTALLLTGMQKNDEIGFAAMVAINTYLRDMPAEGATQLTD